MIPHWAEPRPSFLIELAVTVAVGAGLAIAGGVVWLAMDWAVTVSARWIVS